MSYSRISGKHRAPRDAKLKDWFSMFITFFTLLILAAASIEVKAFFFFPILKYKVHLSRSDLLFLKPRGGKGGFNLGVSMLLLLLIFDY